MDYDAIIEIAARTGHEANRAYSVSIGDSSHLPWTEAPDWQKASARQGVLGVLLGNGPEESHASWLDQKRREGWKHGPIKDVDKKEHPCMKAYADLPDSQKKKDKIFVGVARGVFDAFVADGK